MPVPQSLVQFFKPWADFYSHSKTATTVVQYVHIGGLLLAGGLAVAMDRSTLRMLRLPVGERAVHLRELATVHRLVITGIGVIAVSGLALLTADLETFLGSWIYWTKMVLVVLLLWNGFRMTRVEKSLALDSSEGSPSWPALQRTAKRSVFLWFLVAAFGVALANFS